MKSNSFIQMQTGQDLSAVDLQGETLAQLKTLLSTDESPEASAGREISPKTTVAWVVVFHGPAGDAQSQAAAALGKAMGRPVYKVELSAVISKYIAETEKKLSRLFAAAVRSGAILYFDEADALFAKRTRIQDAHDRYANMEANYLLQLAEQQNVPVILSTKTRQNIDKAFIRRLRGIVQF